MRLIWGLCAMWAFSATSVACAPLQGAAAPGAAGDTCEREGLGPVPFDSVSAVNHEFDELRMPVPLNNPVLAERRCEERRAASVMARR